MINLFKDNFQCDSSSVTYQMPYKRSRTEQTTPVTGSICQMSSFLLKTISLAKIENANMAPIIEFTAEIEKAKYFKLRWINL